MQDQAADGDGGAKVPVTILTGFLGSGKTTLMNHILQDGSHKMKFAIIENEFGAVNIDADLVTMKEGSSEEIVEMVNGCMCCNVRGDLIPVVNKLLARKDDFDGILIETTGMADPAPVIQTFLLDEEISQKVDINGVVTVVDTKHLIKHLHEEREEGTINETQQQIAFADKILMNKIDLVDGIEKSNARREIRAINKTAEIIETENSVLDPKLLLGINSFDLERILDFEPTFLEGEEEEKVGKKKKKKKKKKKHDQKITSISFEQEEDIEMTKFHMLMSSLIQEKSDQLYRYKGVISVKGKDEKFVFQGVHMLLRSEFTSIRWKENEKRVSKLVFIGVNLDHEEIEAVFEACKAKPLRFKVNTKVLANVGGWQPATIIKVWDEGNPYRIRLNLGNEVWAPMDTNNFVRKLK